MPLGASFDRAFGASLAFAFGASLALAFVAGLALRAVVAGLAADVALRMGFVEAFGAGVGRDRTFDPVTAVTSRVATAAAIATGDAATVSRN